MNPARKLRFDPPHTSFDERFYTDLRIAAKMAVRGTNYSADWVHQETFLAYWRKYSPDERGRFSVMLRIARNKVLQRIRRESSKRRHFERYALERPGVAMPADILHEWRELISRALKVLTEEQAEFLLFCIEQGGREAAASYGLTHDCVWKRVSISRQLIREHLGEL